MIIKKLSDFVINQICAGEIAERPASVIKELVENSIDAGATDIKIKYENGGKSSLIIWDNGCGMSKDDLEISVQRHTTSKLNNDDLFDINSLGFRGEALASVASCAKLKIVSSNGIEANELYTENGENISVKPAVRPKGTTVDVSDLFFKIPARAKFLKNDNIESLNIVKVIEKLALINPCISFNINDKIIFNKGSLTERISDVLGKDFINNSLKINAKKDGITLTGFISLPEFNKGNSSSIFLFVNNRCIKDKNLTALIKIAYQEVMSFDKYPLAFLDLKCDNYDVDVNVSPTKSEVRFKDDKKVKGFIISSLKEALNGNIIKNNFNLIQNNNFMQNNINNDEIPFIKICEKENQDANNQIISFSSQDFLIQEENFPLGNAIVQLFKTYIISKNQEEYFIIDQHAVHERIVLEKLNEKNIVKQLMLIPIDFNLNDEEVIKFTEVKNHLNNLGFVYNLNQNNLELTEIPAFININKINLIMQKISDDLSENDFSLMAEKIMHKIMSTIACHASVRAGDDLNVLEMNAILREMENCPNASVCNHGRPTFFKLDKKIFDKMFERI